jgi:outer membrane protein assembly factor BamB
MRKRPRQSVLTLIGLVLATLSSGCYWTMPGQDPDRQANNQEEQTIAPDTAASLDEVWSVTLDGGPVSDPVTSGFGVVMSGQRSTYTLAPESGATRWTHTVAAPLSVTQPFVSGNDVLVGRWDTTATAGTATEGLDVTVTLDAGTGDAKGSPIDGQPVALRGEVGLFWDLSYFPPRVNPPFWGVHLTVRDLDSGTSACCNDNYGLNSASPPPPAPAPITLGSDFIFTSGNYMNDPNNPPFSFGNGVRGISRQGPPVCSPPYLCPNWGVPIDGSTSTPPVLSGDQQIVYVGTDAGTVYAVDTTTHSVVWSKSIGSAVTDSPALADGTLFVPSAAGPLFALDAATGTIEWAGSAGSKITQQPAVAGGVVFTGSANGTVAAYDAAGCGTNLCPKLWSRSTGSAITGAPAVSAGRLYVGTADGRVFAYAL